MTRITLNFIIDVLFALVMLAMVLTGLIMAFVLPPGSGRLELWSLGRHDWGDLHFWLAVGIVTVLVVHLAMHWSWVCHFVQRLFVRQPAGDPKGASLYGVLLIVLLAAGLGGFVWLAQQNVVQGSGRHREQASEAPAGPHPGAAANRPAINGSLSIAEAAALVKTTPQELCKRLELPENTPSSTRLRSIAEDKNWSMPDLRQRVLGD